MFIFVTDCNYKNSLLDPSGSIRVAGHENITLKGPIRSFVVVLLGVKSSSENVPNRTKIVQGNKKCVREQKNCNESKVFLLWHIMVLNSRDCLVRSYVALYGLVWFFCCFSRPWPCVASFDFAWPYVT